MANDGVGDFTNLQNSLFHIRTWGGASLQRWKDRNWSKAAEGAINVSDKQVSTKKTKQKTNVYNDPKVKRGKSSLVTKVMIKTLEWKKI